MLVPLGAGAQDDLDGKFVKKDDVQESKCMEGAYGLKKVRGYTETKIKYGDSYLEVKPVSKVLTSSEFRFVLKPQKRESEHRDYKTAIVSITSDDDDHDKPADWLHVKGKWSPDNNVIVACVPNFAEERTYKYNVKISFKADEFTITTGYLDPRADLIPE